MPSAELVTVTVGMRDQFVARLQASFDASAQSHS